MEKIFFSYSHRDRPLANLLFRELSKELLIWWDEDLIVGEEFNTKLMRQIQNSVVMVVLITPNSNESAWVEKEVAYARTHRIPILPLRINGADLPDFIKNYHALEIRFRNESLEESDINELKRQLTVYIEAERKMTERDARRILLESTPKDEHTSLPDDTTLAWMMIIAAIAICVYFAAQFFSNSSYQNEDKTDSLKICSDQELNQNFLRFDNEVRKQFFVDPIESDPIIKGIETNREECLKDVCAFLFRAGSEKDACDALGQLKDDIHSFGVKLCLTEHDKWQITKDDNLSLLYEKGDGRICVSRKEEACNYIDNFEYLKQRKSEVIEARVTTIDLSQLLRNDSLSFLLTAHYLSCYDDNFLFDSDSADDGLQVRYFDFALDSPSNEDVIKAIELAQKGHPDEAVKMLQHPSDRGVVQATEYLATFYESGYGVERNPRKAVQLITDAAIKGSASANFNLGVLYITGRDVPAHVMFGLKLIDMAIIEGFDIKNAIRIHPRGPSSIKLETFSETFKELRLRAEKGNVAAKTMELVFLTRGIGLVPCPPPCKHVVYRELQKLPDRYANLVKSVLKVASEMNSPELVYRNQHNYESAYDIAVKKNVTLESRSLQHAYDIAVKKDNSLESRNLQHELDIAVKKDNSLESRRSKQMKSTFSGFDDLQRPSESYESQMKDHGQRSPIDQHKVEPSKRNIIPKARRSDARLKRNIKRIGQIADGINWYSFEYLDDQLRRTGVIVQELIENGKLLNCIETDENGYFRFRYDIFFSNIDECDRVTSAFTTSPSN